MDWLYPTSSPSSASLAQAVGTVAATPKFSLASGAYASAQTVTITDTTPGAAIYYTLNGTTPSAASTRYTAAIRVATSETIQAIAIASGYTNSAVATATYTIGTSTATTTSLTSSRNPTVLNQGVEFTATIKGNSATTPTGTVSFANGSTVFATAPVVSGVATAMTSSLPLGVNSITATYSGDSSHATSKSATLSQDVQIATTTVLTAFPNPSTLAEAVTFTATVEAASGATPTGTVTFYSSATPLATVTLSGGVAKTTISTLTTGHHTITATYSGNSTDATSKSSVLVQTVNP